MRGHWQIESVPHYILDVTFDEDRSRVRDKMARLNLAALRRMALSFLKRAPDPRVRKRPFSMASKGRSAARRPERYLSKVLLCGI